MVIWLLTGTLPFTGLSGSPVNNTFGISETFNVVGSNVEAALTDNVPCASGAVTGPAAVVTGTIAADGTFAMQPASPSVTGGAAVTIRGTVPATGATSWSGDLTLSSSGGSCPINQSVSFTAVRIAPVTGTYVATVSLTVLSGNSGLPTMQNASLSVALQQGVILPGTTGVYAPGLSGTLSVGGVSCFSTGTITPTSSGVLGAEFEAQGTLNDGSSLTLLEQIADIGTTHLSVQAITGSGGTCGTFFSQPFTLVKQ